MRVLLRAFLLCAAILSAPAHSQQYRVLVGYPPGGVLDLVARIVAERLRESTGHPFVAETRAGATGQLAVDAMLAAPADGTTVLMAPDSNIALYPHTLKKPPFTVNDVAAVAHTGYYRMALAVHPGAPVKDLRGFVEWSKGSAGPVGYGTPGAGSILHFQGLLISQVTGARLNHVGYKGTGPAVTDLVGGHVPAVVVPLGSLLPHARAGKVRILAQTGDERSPSFGDVPSFKELGYPALSKSGWYGLVARAATPPETVQRYNEIVVRALRTPELRAKMLEFQLDVRELSPQQFQQLIREDSDRWEPVIRSSGFTPASE